MSSPKLFLYDHPVSSYAQKVRMALRHKSLPFIKETPATLGSGQPDAAFSSANMRMEVPALIDGDFKIFDSTAILMYLEDAYPEPSLFPAGSTPQRKAEARIIEEVCDTHYEAVNWALGEIDSFKRAQGEEAERLRGGGQGADDADSGLA
jgi:glutathione S-transferase